MSDLNKPEYLDDTDPEKNLDYYRQDHGGMVTQHNGVADKLLQNNDLYRSNTHTIEVSWQWFWTHVSHRNKLYFTGWNDITATVD